MPHCECAHCTDAFRKAAQRQKNREPKGAEDNATLDHQDTLEVLIRRTQHNLVELQALLGDLLKALTAPENNETIGAPDGTD